MAKGATGHLDEERMIEAVLDEAGLEETARRHLIACDACRAQKETLKDRLARFGQVSRKCTPQPLSRPRLSPAEFGVDKPRWSIRPSLGMGLAAASILVVLLSTIPFRQKQVQVYNVQVVYTEMAQDEKFMTEIDGLVENPLPRLYVDLGDPAENSDDTGSQRPSPGGAG